MNRAAMSDAATFTALIAGAFVVRNGLVIGGLASFLLFGFFSG
jgi:hypothetical protein